MNIIVNLPDDKPRSKYRAKRAGKYASQKEAKRAWELKVLERAGKISELREQYPFVLIPGRPTKRNQVRRRPVLYIADFVYLDEKGTMHVEDVKGVLTPVYRLKKRLMEHLYHIEVEET